MNDKSINTLGIEFLGYGHYLPKRKVMNDEIMSTITLGTSSVDEKVLGNVAVKSRYWADEEETVEYMAVEAVNMALKEAGIKPEEVDLLILSNWTSRLWVPDNAPKIALEVGATNALAFDLCGACCGFMHGVNTAATYLMSQPRMKNAVVVCSEQFSKGVRPHSKGQLITGDAAGAVVLTSTEDKQTGLIDLILHSDAHYDYVVGVKKPECWVRSKSDLGEVGAKKNTEVVQELLESTNVSIEDIDWFVPHPGTDVVHEAIRSALNIPKEKFITNYTRVANTSSASIPLVLSENKENGKFKKGDLVLSCGIGAGLYYGAMLYRL